jgi:hypothetical protein
VAGVNISTIPYFKTALATRLAADAGMTGVQITYGLMFPSEPQREWVWLHDTINWTQVSAAIGRLKREETYTLQALVSVMYEVQTTQKVTTERAFALAGVIENSVRLWGQGANAADPFQNSTTGVRFAEVIGDDFLETADTQNREARITLGIRVHARI